MLMHAVACKWGCMDPKESLHWKLTLGRKSFASPGNWTCVSSMMVWCFNQLSYIPSLFVLLSLSFSNFLDGEILICLKQCDIPVHSGKPTRAPPPVAFQSSPHIGLTDNGPFGFLIHSRKIMEHFPFDFYSLQAYHSLQAINNVMSLGFVSPARASSSSSLQGHTSKFHCAYVPLCLYSTISTFQSVFSPPCLTLTLNLTLVPLCLTLTLVYCA